MIGVEDAVRTAGDLEEVLVRLLDGQDVEAWGALEDGVHVARVFADTGLLTRDRGVVVRMRNGAEFQLTVVRAKGPDTPAHVCPECGAEYQDRERFIYHMGVEHGWEYADADAEATAQGVSR